MAENPKVTGLTPLGRPDRYTFVVLYVTRISSLHTANRTRPQVATGHNRVYKRTSNRAFGSLELHSFTRVVLRTPPTSGGRRSDVYRSPRVPRR